MRIGPVQQTKIQPDSFTQIPVDWSPQQIHHYCPQNLRFRLIMSLLYHGQNLEILLTQLIHLFKIKTGRKRPPKQALKWAFPESQSKNTDTLHQLKQTISIL